MHFSFPFKFGSVDGDCVNDLMPCSGTLLGNVFLMLVYGYILGKGSKLIADGAELLLNIANPSLIGGFVLPVLGAVPDAAIIIASCLGDPKEIVEQVSIGVGTLAGSTIMLLTFSLGSAQILGRCDIQNGRAVDQTLVKYKWNPFKSGTSVERDVPINAWIMMVVSLTYAVIQIPAFIFMSSVDPGAHERWFAVAGAAICFLSLIVYSTYCVCNTTMQDRRANIAKSRFVKRRTAAAFLDLMKSPEVTATGDAKPLLGDDEEGDDEEAAPALPANMAMFTRRIKLKAQEAVDRNKYGIDKRAEPEDSDEEEEEAAGWPKWRILLYSVFFMLAGTATVTIFSDPMVDAMSNFSSVVKLPPFYVSFIVSPLASNASELISALIFASKKKRTNMSLTASSLYGAATMNATLCLGIFYCLIALKGLAWRFSGQVIAILACVWIVGIIGSKKTWPVAMSFVILAVYPLCLAIVPIAQFIGLR